MTRRPRTQARNRNFQNWYPTNNQLLTGCSPAKVRLKASWANPRHYKWVAVTLLSKFYNDDGLTDVDLITLNSCHSWLESRLPKLPLVYTYVVSSISMLLQAAGSGGLQSPTTVLRLQTHLSALPVIVEGTREYHSRLNEMARLYSLGLILFTFPPEDGINEEHSPKPPRIRGYRDKGSRRPGHKWLPASFPEEGEKAEPYTALIKAEEVLLRQRGP